MDDFGWMRRRVSLGNTNEGVSDMCILFVDRMKLPFIILKSSFFFLQIMFIIVRLLKSDMWRFQNGEFHHIQLCLLPYKGIYGIIPYFVHCGLCLRSKAVYIFGGNT